VPPDLSEVEEVLKQIVSEGNRASEVIGSVQSMFKGDDQARVPINVNAVIRQTFTLVQGELRSKEIISRLELLNDLPRVLGSRVQLQQVILNLIMNAVEALGTVSDHARTLQVTSSLNQVGDVSVTVDDSGPGIDPAVVERIFDPFLTTKPQGMGMGLSICRTIIEGHGGRIWASPGDPQGSIFHIVLPALEPNNVTGGLTHDYDTLHPQ